MAIWNEWDLQDESIKAWDGASSGPLIPPGTYEFEAVSCEMSPTKAGDGMNFVVEWKVTSDGESNGAVIRRWYLCAGPNLKNGHRGRIKRVFQFALQLGTQGIDTDAVPGRRIIADIVHKTESRYDVNTQQERTFTNADMINESPVEQAAPAPVAAKPATRVAPPKAPSAPPSRPPVAPRPRQ